MFKSTSVTSIAFAALLLLSPFVCPRPVAAEIPGGDHQEIKQAADISKQQPVAIQQAIDNAVPDAVPVLQASPNDSAAPAEKASAPSGQADNTNNTTNTTKTTGETSQEAAKATPAGADRPAPAEPDQAAQANPAQALPAEPDQAASVKPAQAPPADGAASQTPPANIPASPSEFINSEDTTVLQSPAQQDAQQPDAVVEDALKVRPGSSDLLGPVERNVEYFSSTIKKHFTQWLARSGKYIGLMKSILRENYVPEDLVFLSLIESGFNPKAYSMAKASGPWQFIKGTAIRYGLRVDRWVDERRDPIKSTKAAAAYLKDLYDMFGSWPLAMASYNCGEGNILRAVKRNDTEDFWELRKTRSIPSETKDYVPKFVAARMIAENPQQYGFDDLTYDKPFEFDEVTLDHCTDLATVAKCCEVPESEIKDLNPELLRGCTPPNRAEYTLRVPKGTKDTFLKNYAALPDNEKIDNPPREPSSRPYVVRRGDTLRSIARRFHVSLVTLAKANRLRVTSRIRRGRRLRAPGYKGATVADNGSGREKKAAKKAAAMEAADNGGKGSGHSKPAVSTRYYKVRRGDTLYRIAKGHGITIAELARLNGLRVKSKLRPGQRLALAAKKASRKTAEKHARKKYVSRRIYRVRRGDTLYSIAKKFKVSKDKLARVNSISGSSIKRGQKLIIPDGEAA